MLIIIPTSSAGPYSIYKIPVAEVVDMRGADRSIESLAAGVWGAVGISVLVSYFVHLAVIYAKAKRTVFFGTRTIGDAPTRAF